MKDTRIIMGMPITVELVDASAPEGALEEVFAYFSAVDQRFSTYKDESEIMQINRGEVSASQYSAEMREVLALAEDTRRDTDGYFDIKKPDESLDPSGIVKGWAIHNVAEMLQAKGYRNFYVDAGGDIQSRGRNSSGKEWSIGIQNPMKAGEIVKIVSPRGKGVATSGTYMRGPHIYNPKNKWAPITEIMSLTVIGPNIYEADRFATAAFAMGRKGVHFIERLEGFEAYLIDQNGIATMTCRFEDYSS